MPLTTLFDPAAGPPYSLRASPPILRAGGSHYRSVELQIGLVRLVRTWIDIIADQPALVRGLMLVLFLSMLSLYVLGIASLVAASRLAPAAAAGQIAVTTPALAVERTVLSMVTQIAELETPTPQPLASPTVIAGAAVIFAEPRDTAIPGGKPTITPTLEATPTQVRTIVRIAPPPEPSVAPSRPIAPAPIVVPAPLHTGTPLANGFQGTPVFGTSSRTPTAIFRPSTPGTPTPAATPAGTRSAAPTVGLDQDETPVAPTPTVRLGAPISVGTCVATARRWNASGAFESDCSGQRSSACRRMDE